FVRDLQLDWPVPGMMFHFGPPTVDGDNEGHRPILRNTKTLKRDLQFEQTAGGDVDIRAHARGITAATRTLGHRRPDRAVFRADDDSTPLRLQEIDAQLLIAGDRIAHRHRSRDLQIQIVWITAKLHARNDAGARGYLVHGIANGNDVDRACP